MSQEECARLREGVPYVKVYRYNPKHLCPKLNGYADNGQRILKFDSCYTLIDYQIHINFLATNAPLPFYVASDERNKKFKCPVHSCGGLTL